MENGLSGSIAKAFLQSKLTVLLMAAFLLIGGYSTFLIPREEEPQIKVPMADIFIGYPGASPADVATKVTAPMEKIISNIQGVEYVYSTSMSGQAMLIVQFKVGEDVERSMVKLYSELLKNMDRMPSDATMPLIKTRAIDDVPVMSITLWSDHYNDFELKQLAQVLQNELKKTDDVAEVAVIGGRSKQLSVVLHKEQMTAANVDFLSIARQIEGSNVQSNTGSILQQDTAFAVETGNFISSAEEAGNLVVGINQQQPVYLRQVATISMAPEVANQYVLFGYGNADTAAKHQFSAAYPAVTLSIAKKRGADAMQLSATIARQLQQLKPLLLPADVQVTTSRDYGESASHKVSELLLHLFVSIVVVTLFVMLAMGWRGGLVVFLSVPVTFALTLFSYYFLHYTLNRITLFALVFITGIVVDDSIIIAENMHRHFKMKKLPPLQAAIYAINEVGNPTILATLTVVAAVLPMAFVSGMMGPYMSPMPIGASIAMMLSLVVALTLTPYLGYIFLREKESHHSQEQQGHGKSVENNRIYRIYAALIGPMLQSRWKRWTFMLVTASVLIGSMLLFYTKSVALKMLPFDNKNEFQVVIDMPEGTTLERTQAVAKDIATYVASQSMVKHYQVYTGTAAPISFNGLVRHYDLRKGNHVADIQVTLTDKSERSSQSHEIAKQMRGPIQAIARKYSANVKIVEVPPGPPVLSTLVAEVYGPDYGQQILLAQQVKALFEKKADVVDVDWMVEAEEPMYHFEVDREKAVRLGLSASQVNAGINAALNGMPAGNLYEPGSFSPTPIQLQLSDDAKTNVDDLLDVTLLNNSGKPVPVRDVVTVRRSIKPRNIYRKNQKNVVYVLADISGQLESPSYAIAAISDSLKQLQVPKGYTLEEAYTKQPELQENYSIKWDGEWQITYEVFRDLGIAFAVVLLLIYILIVGWFQHFTVPLVMLAAIPLSLIGIVLGHWIMHAYFTATSMIGFIALAGVMVRNSVLLIDFINIRLRDQVPLKQAIIEAGAVRTTPILLTAGAVVLGAIIILFDPIFQGLAISLMGGTITSTFLTLIVVPLLYFKMMRKKSATPTKPD